jgi:ribosomal protein L24
MEIIKYFEQDRGTLVLDVISDCSCILVSNICMMRTQVKSLQQEIADDSLLNKFQDMFFSKVDITEFDIQGVKLRIVLDEQELNTVLSELS